MITGDYNQSNCVTVWETDRDLLIVDDDNVSISL